MKAEDVFTLCVLVFAFSFVAGLFTHSSFALDPIIDNCQERQSFIYKYQKYECRATGVWSEE